MSDETYGYRRIHAQLARWGVPCGPELVRGIMRELDLQPCQPRPWRFNLTEQDDREHRIPDLLEQDFTADAPGKKLIGDITYIPTWEGWLYLATVIDCHTRMVVGYAMADNYKTPLIAAALKNAARSVDPRHRCDLPLRSRAATTRPTSSPASSRNSDCANRSGELESATIMRWPSRSSPH